MIGKQNRRLSGNKFIAAMLLALLSILVITAAPAAQSQDKENSDRSAPAGESLVQDGRDFYNNHRCETCHSTDGSDRIGPSFKNLYGKKVTFNDGRTVTADEDYIKHAITHPRDEIVEGYPPVMPSAYADLSQHDLDALVAFIESLGSGEEAQQRRPHKNE